MKFLIAFVAAIAVVSADLELDALEKSGFAILQKIHTHLGGEGENSLNTFLTNSDFVRGAVEQVNKTKSDKIEEGVGSQGATFISITKGKKQVNVTTVYGVGAGVVVNLKDRKKEVVETPENSMVEEPTEHEVDAITEPLFAKYVNDILKGETAKDAIVVDIRDGGRRALNLRARGNDLRVRARGGLRVGAKTTVSKRG